MLLKNNQFKQLSKVKSRMKEEERQHNKELFEHKRYKLIKYVNKVYQQRQLIAKHQQFTKAYKPEKVSWNDTYRSCLSLIKTGKLTV